MARLLTQHFPEVASDGFRHLDIAVGELSALGMQPDLEQAIQLRGQRRTLTSYPDGLTGREVEVLRLLAHGHSNQQIAIELTISLHTAGHHVSNILAKTGAVNRTEAAFYAFQRGLAKPST
jgi:DNA-binding NarL/FixJ family response regulator